MDARRFDALTQALTIARSRRGALAPLLGGTLGLLGLTDTAGKKGRKKKGKGKKKKRKSQSNTCASRDDCGADGNGNCYCSQPATGGAKVCTTNAFVSTVPSCTATSCPTGTRCVESGGTFYCVKPCGVVASCADGAKNGNETDVDCGGASCLRCANGKRCSIPNDCAGGACTSNTCQACTPGTNNCGSEGGSSCFCHASATGGSPICASSQYVSSGSSCPSPSCPTGTSCVKYGATFYCVRPCGAA